MKPTLDDLLEAEDYFTEIFKGKKELPNSTESPEYKKLVKYVELVEFAYENLKQTKDADSRLRGAKRKGFLRANGQQVMPIKEAIKIGAGANHIKNLTETVNNPEYGQLYTLISKYNIEIALKTLEAYNSLMEIKRNLCVKAGSGELLVEPRTKMELDATTGKLTGGTYAQKNKRF